MKFKVGDRVRLYTATEVGKYPINIGWKFGTIVESYGAYLAEMRYCVQPDDGSSSEWRMASELQLIQEE